MTDDDELREPVNADAAQVRLVVGDDGRVWEVRETTGPNYDRRAKSLIFLCDEAMRRVRDYPANWLELSDVELLVVSLGR